MAAMKDALHILYGLLFGAILAGCGGGEVAEGAEAGQAVPTSSGFLVTERSLDLAVGGEGLFVLQSASGSQRSYSRLGRLGSDHQGRLIHADGATVLGTSSVPGRDAEPLPQAPLSIPPRMTAKVSIEGNLDARAEEASVPFDPSDAESYRNAMAVTIFAPAERVLVLYFRKLGDFDWKVHAELDRQLLAATLVLRFEADGLADVSTPRVLNIPAGEGGLPAAVNVDLSRFTRFGVAFGITDVHQDGYPFGVLVGTTVSGHGEVSHWYDNGQSKPGGQLVLARFTVADRLHRFAGSSWRCGSGCAQPRIGIPGSVLLGQLQSGALNSAY